MTMSRKPRNEMSTITATPKNTRAYRRKRCLPNDSIIDEILTTTPKKRTAYGGKQYLPHDLIIEEILTKVPTVALLVSGAVSKAWYYSIHIDKRLTRSHFLRSQKEPNLILNLLNVKVGVTDAGKSKYSSQFFRVANGNFHRLPYYLSHVGKGEMVGYCNGFPCTALAGCYTILNPSRCDYLRIINPAIDGKLISNAHIICHGFGFDSLANTYKLVSIFCTSPNQFNVGVFSLGTKSWRNVTATSALISDGHSIIRLRAGTSSDKSAIYCSSFSSTGSSSSSSSGCLVWKLITTIVGGEGANTNYENSSVETEMLLSFNLHDEKFQYIKLPTKSVADEKENQFLVDHPHLLEFRGSPCIARLEKRSRIESDYYHRQSHDHQGSSCCCCCKIHLYVLKDKAKWVKEESFDVRMKSTRNSLLVVPDPCCFCVDITPLTRIFSFSNEILLYWFDGEHLQVYNLRSEKLKIVIPQHALERDIFLAKMKEPLHILDYQLHRQGENFLSLQTFVPEGVAGIDADSFHKLYSKTDSYSAFVFVHKDSGQYYPF